MAQDSQERLGISRPQKMGFGVKACVIVWGIAFCLVYFLYNVLGLRWRSSVEASTYGVFFNYIRLQLQKEHDNHSFFSMSNAKNTSPDDNSNYG
jgi:hypothetical protein